MGQQILQRSRVPGLAYFSIPFGYQLTSTIPLIFGIFLVEKRRFFKSFGLSVALILCFLALFASLSKAAIIGGIVGLFLVMYLIANSKGRKRKMVISFILISTVIILILNTLTGNLIWENFSKPTTSTLFRIPLWLASLEIFLENPFGIGVGQFNKYGAKFFPELSDLPGAHYILTTTSHNQFLDILVYFGIPGLLLLIIFYYCIFRGLFTLYHNAYNSSYFIRGTDIGLIGSFSAYIMDSLFHNMGPFMIDPFNWYFIGMAMSLYNYHSRVKAKGNLKNT